jgi:hypothetical protein
MSAAAGAAGAIAAAVAERRYRELIASLEEQGAVDAASAAPLPARTRSDRSVIRELVRHGAINEAAPGTYWLDREAADTWHARRKRTMNRALGVISAVAATAAVAILALR